MLVFIVERKFLHKEIVNDGVDVQLLVGFRVVAVFQILLNCPNLIFYGIKQRSVSGTSSLNMTGSPRSVRKQLTSSIASSNSSR